MDPEMKKLANQKMIKSLAKKKVKKEPVDIEVTDMKTEEHSSPEYVHSLENWADEKRSEQDKSRKMLENQVKPAYDIDSRPDTETDHKTAKQRRKFYMLKSLLGHMDDMDGQE